MNRFKQGLGKTHSGKQICTNETLNPRKYKPMEPENLVIPGIINSMLLCMYIHTYIYVFKYRCVHTNVYICMYTYTHIYIEKRETERDNICIK